MSVVVSQRNRAVSQAAVEAATTARRFTYKNLFALPGGHNLLNGTFTPFGSNTDSGWWGSELSDSEGYLPNPAVLTVLERASAYTYSIRGIQNNYPVDFTLDLYLNNALQKSVEVVGNTQSSIDVKLDKAYDIDKLVLTITRISIGNDVLKIATASFNLGISNLMKAPERRIHGRVEITYANAIKDSIITTNEGAYGSSGDNLNNDMMLTSGNFFKLHDNKLDGSYVVAGSGSERGWWPKTMPDESGVYTTPQTLTLTFSQRNLYGIKIVGHPLDYPTDFEIKVTNSSNVATSVRVLGNYSNEYSNSTLYRDAVRIDITISRTSRPNHPVVIMEVPVVSSIIYNDADLIDVSLLEELSYEDTLEKLGGVSANELTVNFNNEDKSFYFNNSESRIAGYLKKNRKVRAWLGVEVPDSGDVIWSVLGTFWTYSWDIPVGSLTAKVTAFDTLGLLGTQTYFDHKVYRNYSIGQLVDTVLTTAKAQFSVLTWFVEPALYDIIIPIAWFEYGSYTAALNRIAACDLIHVYCARDGRIVVSKRLSGVSSPDDVWSDATNIIDKSYPTLYTAPSNYLDVYVSHINVAEEEVLNLEDANYSVRAGETRSLTFSSPVESIVSIDIDSTATYNYKWFSWGIQVTFTSAGVLRSAKAVGMALEINAASYIHQQNDESIDENGIIPCEIKSDFIQTTEHAMRIADYLYSRIDESVYDVEVTYRGDIALTLNSKISLPEGIAPNNLYFIKRHELYWNGALSGTARLNT